MRSCYLDASAAVKLISRETESADLQRWIDQQDEVLSSELLRLELFRTAGVLRLTGVEASFSRLEEVLSRIALLEIDRPLLSAAAKLEPIRLRSLDCIHLATALVADGVTDFVTYDRALAEAAALHGFTIQSPGAVS
jgi:predicted nucleic acid-binding protein